LKKRLAGVNAHHPVYRTLAERLDRLRERTLAAAEQSIEWLREAFTLAKDLTVAEKREDESGQAGLDLLPDPNVGALTQIFNEFAPGDAPDMIRTVVTEIDAILKEVRFEGWAKTQKGDRLVRLEVRNALRKFKMHTVPGLFDRAYEYIAEHY
jgi:type I restriction enzyme R subunit